MAAFHVYVVGPVGTTPDAMRALAEAMAARYGLPAAELVARMAKGRFRVKANIDRATADTYRADLEAIGARVVIEDAATPVAPAVSRTSTAGSAAPAVSRTSTAASALPVASRTATGASPLASALPPAAAARTATSSLPPASVRPQTTNPPQFASGLSAAFSGPGDQMESSSLGVLEDGDSILSLASLDGHDDAAASGSFGPPGEPALPASIGPAAAPVPRVVTAAKVARPKDAPLDAFAPPDAEEHEVAVDFAVEELEHRAQRVSMAPATTAAPSQTPAMRAKPAAEPPRDERASSTNKLGPLANPRTRFAAGVFLAILIGFVPAHLVAAVRDKSAYRAIETKLAAIAETATFDEAEQAWHDAVSEKRSAHRTNGIIAMLIWAAAGGALGFGWFRLVPWDRYES